jgi:hypothetical protein
MAAPTASKNFSSLTVDADIVDANEIFNFDGAEPTPTDRPKRATWTVVKAFLKLYFDTLYPSTTGVAIVTKTDNYVAQLTDAGKMITYNKGTVVTGTIPTNAGVPYPVGTELHFAQLGVGALDIASTDTLNVEAGLTLVLNGQYAVATAKKITTTSWILFGNLEPV